jgi:hypothetical protein
MTVRTLPNVFLYLRCISPAMGEDGKDGFSAKAASPSRLGAVLYLIEGRRNGNASQAFPLRGKFSPLSIAPFSFHRRATPRERLDRSLWVSGRQMQTTELHDSACCCRFVSGDNPEIVPPLLWDQTERLSSGADASSHATSSLVSPYLSRWEATMLCRNIGYFYCFTLHDQAYWILGFCA